MFLVYSGICLRSLGEFFIALSCVVLLIPPYRKHAKVSDEGVPQDPIISNEDIEAAKREWADLVLSDDE